MLSVVIPAWNETSALPATLAALRAQGPEHEVVVVDAASSDATAAVAASAGARVVTSSRRNRALARNLGARAATGARIAFIDADCTPQPGWLAALAGCLERAPLVAGPVRFVAAGPAPRAAERFDVLWRVPQERYVAQAGLAGGGNLAVRREAFDSVGGFDAALHAGEDTDFCLRAAAGGFALAYCDEAVVTHPAATRLGDVLHRGFEHGASARRLARRHPGRAGRRYWNHPGGLVRHGAALKALGVEPQGDRGVELVARLDYAARMAGSLWAELVPRSLR